MGIVNLSPDSFSGDATPATRHALDRARQHLANGADCIDVGAESARAGIAPIPPAQELARLYPFLEAWPELVASFPPPSCPHQLWPPLLSVNTWRPEVAVGALPLGVDLLNDMGALPDPRNARLCADHDAALLIMHSVGQPKVSHTHVHHPDIMASLDEFFTAKIKLALGAGLPLDHIVIDPGIDFAKQAAENLTLLRHLDQLHAHQRPILLPISRKTVIGQVLEIPDPAARDPATVALLSLGLSLGAALFRVHNVPAMSQALRVLHALHAG